MKVTALINNVSRIARMVELSEGDIYKRIKEKTDGYGGEAKVYFGKVISIVATDEASVVEVLEFATGWSGEEPVRRVFSSDEDLHITECQPREFSAELNSIVQKMRRNIALEETNLENKKKLMGYVEDTLKSSSNLIEKNETRAYVEA